MLTRRNITITVGGLLGVGLLWGYILRRRMR